MSTQTLCVTKNQSEDEDKATSFAFYKQMMGKGLQYIQKIWKTIYLKKSFSCLEKMMQSTKIKYLF